jgi:DNA topoisomerase IB
MCPVGKRVKAWLDSIRTTVDETRTLAVELRADHATYKAAVDEIHTWAETLAAKLNADAGVTDTDYDAVITNDAPAALTAGDPAAAPATLDTYE